MNNEELQSRREFFKKAAKAALPVIAVAAFAAAPTIVNATESSMGCSERSCTNYCMTGCTGCRGCKGNCEHTCLGSCRNSCSGSCDSSSH